jgi:hypothetical protein
MHEQIPTAPSDLGLEPKQLNIEDVQKLIGGLYLEIEMLRRYVQTLKTALEHGAGRDGTR